MRIIAIMKSIEQRMAAAWRNKYIIRRALSTQILMSPQSLVSLDFPENWTPTPDSLRPPTLNCCECPPPFLVSFMLITATF